MLWTDAGLTSGKKVGRASGNWRLTSVAISRSPITSGAVLWRQPTPTIGLRSKISMPGRGDDDALGGRAVVEVLGAGNLLGPEHLDRGEDDDHREAHRQRDAARLLAPRCPARAGVARTAPTATVTPAATNEATDLASTRPNTASAASG